MVDTLGSDKARMLVHRQPDSLDDRYSPLSASEHFQQALDVSVESLGTFRVYITQPQQKDSRNCQNSLLLGAHVQSSESDGPDRGIQFVFHHGAGYSGLSAACFAREVHSQSQAEFGVMSFDCRGHGSSRVGNGQTGPPDLSLETLSNDLVGLLETMYPNRNDSPDFVLIGHSMGGAVVTEACSKVQDRVGRVLGLVILDVVEGSAMSSLISMMPLIESRPTKFKSISECIRYHISSHTIRNLDSARISVPGLIRPSEASSYQGLISPSTVSSTTVSDPPEQEYTWVTDLRLSQPYWKEWYRGLSNKFLSQKTARLLVLAGTDRLDKDLIIGQMQGKYQLSVMASVGHCVHEDDPSKLAEIIITFARRNDTSGSDEILARLGKKPMKKKS
ncbi:Alpha/Beta hydrolase protein [Phakopsora pachyrhizi]|uniref:Protein phosphatase methylesterase 1 n=1 Tax=Phakopsora pachyrhizi TaxID=170000 RepID=A0AAV0BBE9_PHAPC|nr:Alpha/Beta hydrolase protein [Phakopsora pachyrhizi]CAH7683719.1 Alpha/Beta hydrolase protein [Phakopsora pachyrhizi]